jgi:hypothetical protein
MTILGLAGVVVAALIVAVILYLVVVIFAPGFSVPEQPLQRLGPAVKDGADSPSDRPPPSRRSARVLSEIPLSVVASLEVGMEDTPLSRRRGLVPS